MPTPDPRRRPLARPAAPQKPAPAPTAAPTPTRPPHATSAHAPRTHSRRTAPEANQKQLVYIAGGFIVVAIGVVLFLLLRGGEPAKPPLPLVEPAPPPTASTTNAAGAPAAAAGDPAAAVPTATPVLPAPTPAKPVVKPTPTAKPTMEAIVRRLAAATTAAAADAAGHDAESISDLKLANECWRKAYDLDPNDADARAKLDVRALEPPTDLPGFTAIQATTQRIHLKPFQEAARGDLTGTERADLIARWTKLRPAIEARTAKIKSEPYWNQVDELRTALLQKKFFSSLEYEMVELPPYALLVEVEGKPDQRAKRRDAAEQSYKPFLDAYDKRIRSYLFPLAPKAPEKDPLFPVFVFLNVERYHAYSIDDHGSAPLGVRAHYEPGKKQCFTYSPVLKVGLGAFEEGVQSLLHELTHAWVDRLASSDGGENCSIECLTSHWFSEGIAEYMSCQFMHQGEVRFQPWRSQRVAGAYRPPGWRIALKEALVIPLHALDGYAASKVSDLAPDKRAEAISLISSGFYADMSNFILWLNLRSGANRPREFEAYAREELAGRGGIDAFKRCVPKLLDEVKDLDAAIDQFVLKIANGKINPYQEFEEASAPAPAGPKK